jgi:hypothetical protein
MDFVVFLIIAIVWIGIAIVKKVNQERQREAALLRGDDDDEEGQDAFETAQDEIRTFLEQMGAAPPAPRPVPEPVVRSKPVAKPERDPAPAKPSAAEALRAAAAKRAGRAVPKREKTDRLAAYRTESPAAPSGMDPIPGLSRLPFMQRAVVLREILGPPPGLGSGGPLERKV